MWVLLDRRIRLTIVAGSVLALTAVYLGIYLMFHTISTPFGLITSVATSFFSATGLVGLVAALLGPRQSIWKLSLKIPGIAAYLKFPDVNGIWIGQRTSAYLMKLAQEQGSSAPPPDAMALTIRQSWLHLKIETRNIHGKTVSHSVLAHPEIWNNGPRIWSMYIGQVAKPQQTEESMHHGGAVLYIQRQNDGFRIIGTYFTDRGITHHLPSSGQFTLKKFSDDPDLILAVDQIREFGETVLHGS
jgi:SMODS-associating 2TM, beta-strand rich effector domain